MAEPLDVAARLAEGRPSVDTIGDYVWACHLLGYQNPDLTLHAGQVGDWYAGEDGLDLRALESDRAGLSAAATATDSARQLQEQQLEALAGAWRGRGGDASREFLIRHGEASLAAATAVRDAVDALTALRDELWHAIDGKVASAVEIDDRRQGERAEWLAATRTLTTGTGDRAAASELIDQQVKPFVDNDIRSDWLTAMQRAMMTISAAFDAATAVLTGSSAARFEVPGDLGPSPMPSPPDNPSPAAATGTTPAGWPQPAPAMPAAPTMAPAAGPIAAPPPAYSAAPDPLAATAPAIPAPSTAPAAATPPMPSMPSLGEMGGGLPGAAGGLAGWGTQLADAIGALLDRPADASEFDDQPLAEDGPTADEDKPQPGDEDPDREGPDDGDPNDAADDESDSETTELAETDEPIAEPADTCEQEPVDETPPADPVPTQPPAAMPPPQPIVGPPPSAEPVGAETPCGIAADELPQAGP